MTKLTQEQLRSIINTQIKEVLEDYEEAQLHSPFKNVDEIEEFIDTRDYLLSDIRENLSLGKYSTVDHMATDILNQNGITIDKESKDYKKLCRELMKAVQVILQIEQKRATGDYQTEHKILKTIPGHTDQPSPTPSTDSNPSPQPSTPAKATPYISELLPSHIGDKSALGNGSSTLSRSRKRPLTSLSKSSVISRLGILHGTRYASSETPNLSCRPTGT